MAPQQDRVHLANGTLYLDGTFTPGKPEIVRSRLGKARAQLFPQIDKVCALIEREF